ncbi:7TM diverse intracellular signaling domain-containing protein [Glaciecola sp. 2405UD65-10]|uniref:7TM diverse intracellular signaling domain-containing protein n=1 Tax=Glaciecola sp. 2405UD65-10 TaxID=3397244 RepID=UPI003B5C7146
MINSIKLPAIKQGEQLVILLPILFCFIYLLSKNISSTAQQGYVANVEIHKSDNPIPLDAADDAFNWQPMKNGSFNLGRHSNGLIRIQLDHSKLPYQGDLVFAIARNNIFTDAILYYHHKNMLEEKLLTPSTIDNKLLSNTLTKEAINSPVYISISGRYLRGELLILTAKEFASYIKSSSVKDGIYFGFIILFLLFSLLGYVYFRQAIFLKYAALLICMFLWVAAGEGLLVSTFPQIQGLPFFTPNGLGLLFFICFAYFSYDYLKLADRQSKASQLLKYSQSILIFIWLCYCVSFERADPTLYQIVYGLALLKCLLVVAVTFVTAIRTTSDQRKRSRYYLCALIAFVICSVISGLSVTNIIDYYAGWTFIKVSFLIEMLLLASGLIYGYKVTLTNYEDKTQQHKIVEEKLTSTQQKLAESSSIIENNNNRTSLCPQIAKVIALLNKTLFIKATGNYSEIVYQNGASTKELLVDTNLQAIENALGAQTIIRCHKSYMVKAGVNYKLTRRTSADFDLTFAEHRIPVGRKYLKNIRSAFN